MANRRALSEPAARNAVPRGDPPAAGSRSTPRPVRIAAIDTARGLAVVAMIAYHFAFDLRYYALTQSDFVHDAFWLGARAAIVTAFLLLVGISAALAARTHAAWPGYLRRTAIIAACAVAVTAGSYAMFPRSYIYFGILHAVVAMSLLAWPLARRPRAAFVLGVIVIAAGLTFAHPLFDSRGMSVIGFMTHKPLTEDYVPLFPWTGVVFIGIAAGAALGANRFAWLAPLAPWPRPLAWLGRHSLAVYMVHQPLLLGGLWLALRSARP